MPTSTCDTHASTGPHQLSNTPNGASTSMKTAQAEATRKTTNATKALTRSRTASGVASWAKNVLCHLMAPITGYVDSLTAIVIAWEATRPGTMNAR